MTHPDPSPCVEHVDSDMALPAERAGGLRPEPAAQSQPEALIPRAILARLEAANEALAAKHSEETYLRMIDVDKATEELQELDEARRLARSALRIVGCKGLKGASIVELADRDGSFVAGPDGCIIFWPEENRGAFNSWHLRSIADELDRRNAGWFAQMDAFCVAQEIEHRRAEAFGSVYERAAPEWDAS